MLETLKTNPWVKRFLKTKLFLYVRQLSLKQDFLYIDDREHVDSFDALPVTIDWPPDLPKPHIGLVRDHDIYPRWTKSRRFLESNDFSFEIYNLHASDWLEKAKSLDLIVGIPSSVPYDLDEARRKFYFLEQHMGKYCYPCSAFTQFYEDKRLVAAYAEYYGFPMAKTYISHDRAEALQWIETQQYPLVSKTDPSSGSMGVDLVKDVKSCRRLVRQAFSPSGRRTHLLYLRQKNYIYLQEFIPNDGLDLRVILVDNKAFGYYRRAPVGDFRASGMDMTEKRDLPPEAIRLAWQLNQVLKSPQLVVDMLHGQDGKYHIIEISPFCQMKRPRQLEIDGEAGMYIISEDGSIRFEKCQYWLHELALRQYLEQVYIPGVRKAV